MSAEEKYQAKRRALDAARSVLAAAVRLHVSATGDVLWDDLCRYSRAEEAAERELSIAEREYRHPEGSR